MKTFDHIKKLVAKLPETAQRFSFGSYKNYLRDWITILIIAAVLLVGFVGGSIYLFWGLESQDVFSAGDAPEEATLTIDRKHLSSVLEQYEQRAAHFEQLKSSPPRITDPR